LHLPEGIAYPVIEAKIFRVCAMYRFREGKINSTPQLIIVAAKKYKFPRTDKYLLFTK
jgi:hypothetical protein